MKFTEEQYQKIIDAWDLEDTYAEAKQAVVDVISVFVTELLQDEVLTIANPLTRKWAHEQYVEKEKRYVWTSKKHTNSGYVHRLFKSTYDGVLLATVSPEAEIVEEEYLTESEIREWGYDPERFDKEEVE